MDKLETALQYLIHGIIAGELKPWFYILGIALGVVLVRNFIRWVARKYGGFFGIVLIIVLVVIIYGYSTQPEVMDAILNKVATKIERFFTTAFG